jgi:Na+/proline symporter
MSTVSADWLIGATAAVKDLYGTYINPKMSDASIMKGTRIALYAVGIFCVVGTYLWQDGIGKAWYYLGGFQVAIFFVPILGGLFYKKKTATGGFITLIVTTIVYIVWEFILGAPYYIPSNVITWVTSLVVFFISCNLTYKKSGKLTQ